MGWPQRHFAPPVHRAVMDADSRSGPTRDRHVTDAWESKNNGHDEGRGRLT